MHQEANSKSHPCVIHSKAELSAAATNSNEGDISWLQEIEFCCHLKQTLFAVGQSNRKTLGISHCVSPEAFWGSANEGLHPSQVLPALCKLLFLWRDCDRLFLHAGSEGGAPANPQQIPPLHFFHPLLNR